MADLLTHALAGYCIGIVLSFYYEWMGPEHITLVMLGAVTPDLSKISKVVPSSTIETLLGVPFFWGGLHTLGGSVIIALLGGILVASEHRRAAIALLFLGALSHHALDLLLLQSSGYAYPVFWPLTEYQPPAGMLYRSSDRWPALLTGTLALILWLTKGYVERSATDSESLTDN